MGPIATGGTHRNSLSIFTGTYSFCTIIPLRLNGKMIVQHGWLAWLSPAGLLLASWLAIASLSLRLPAGAEAAAIIFPPWWTAQQSIAAIASTDNAIIRTTAIPAIMVVQLAGHDGLARLHQAGAWFAIDPQALNSCFKK